MEALVNSLLNYGLAGVLLAALLYGCWYVLRTALPSLLAAHREQIDQLTAAHREQMNKILADYRAELALQRQDAAEVMAHFEERSERVTTAICDRLDRIDHDLAELRRGVIPLS